MNPISAVKTVVETACLAFLHALETTGDREFSEKVGMIIINNAFPMAKESPRKESEDDL